MVNAARVPVFDETRRIADMLGIDPLGLIGSGSLLICCRTDTAQGLCAKLDTAGIPAATIGSVGPPGRTVNTVNGKEWPEFPVDEITRLFQ